MPASSGLCFSQVRRCDPGALSSLCSLSWKCKGLGGGAEPPSRMLQQGDTTPQKAVVCMLQGSAAVRSMQAWVGAGKDLVSGVAQNVQSYLDHLNPRWKKRLHLDWKPSRGMAQLSPRGKVGAGFLPTAAGAAVWLLPFKPHLLTGTCPGPRWGASDEDSKSKGSSHLPAAGSALVPSAHSLPLRGQLLHSTKVHRGHLIRCARPCGLVSAGSFEFLL